MVTTIQIDESTKLFLDKLKIMKNESYNDLISYILEDYLELNTQTKKELEESIKRASSGKVITHAEAKNLLGL